MLVLSRKAMQQVHIGDNITITVVKVDRGSVRVSIEAPRDVRILRGELSRFDADQANTPTAEAAAASEATGAAGSAQTTEAAYPFRRSRAVRRAIPEVDRRASSTSRAAAHPMRWTMASMRQRTATSPAQPAAEAASEVTDNR